MTEGGVAALGSHAEGLTFPEFLHQARFPLISSTGQRSRPRREAAKPERNIANNERRVNR
jgi:hypothetical protein